MCGDGGVDGRFTAGVAEADAEAIDCAGAPESTSAAVATGGSVSCVDWDAIELGGELSALTEGSGAEAARAELESIGRSMVASTMTIVAHKASPANTRRAIRRR